MFRSRTDSCIDPAQKERFGISGIFEREERDESEMGKNEIRIPKPRIWVQGILHRHDWEKCESDMRIGGKSVKDGQRNRPMEHL